MALSFTLRLREPIMRGDVTCSIRIWQSPRVRLGGCYALGDGHVEVTRLCEIDLIDVTPELARSSGFADLDDLMTIARHGRGERVFMVEFRYVPKARP